MIFDVGNGDEVEHSERPALEQLVGLGYNYKTRSEIIKEREKTTQVLLHKRLKDALHRINPDLDEDGISDAFDQIKEDSFPFAHSIIETNKQVHAKLIGLSQSSGLEPITVEQNNPEPTIRTVKLFDFVNIENNDFLVTNQFKLQGNKEPIYPDIIIFVNGIPLVILECKSPFRTNWLFDAVEKENFKKYRSTGVGYEKLMFYNQILVVTCGIKARYGTITSNVNEFEKSRWSSIFPSSIKQEEKSENREQETLIAGMLNKATLLNLVRNFIIYQTRNDQKIKIIAKHQQYRAANKCLEKIIAADSKRGGVISHTQGSGKSFTMHWVAKLAIQHNKNPPLVIVTDRRQLDQQIHTTFSQIGFPDPLKAKKSSDLSDFIKSPKGKTMMTTIQKFEEINNSTNEQIVVLVDEAHRTQYGIAAGAMDKAIPNGIYFGFTGTPIDKKDKSTFQIFGNLLDKYGFEESKADGSTIPITYVGRISNLFIEGDESIDELFDKIVSSEPNMTPEFKEKLKRECVSKQKIAEVPQRIKKIAWDIFKHYTDFVEPNGYKAMIVVSSRESAVLYKKELDSLNAPPSRIIMEQKPGEFGKDGKNWDEYYLSDSDKRKYEDSFKLKDDPTKFLIVVDMLLVGFDAPIVQVLYLDKPLKEHNLLQAIARVNRPYDDAKTVGLVVDYYGVTRNIQKALEIFHSDDIKGAWESDDHKLGTLKQYHDNALSYFEGLDRDDLEKITLDFKSIERRDSFENDFKKFAKLLNSLMYKKESVQYVADFKYISKMRNMLHNVYDNHKFQTRKFAPKIQQLIDDAIRSSGVSELVKPINITYDNFLAFVSKFESSRARAALIINKAQQVIEENRYKNPAYYEKLWERLNRLIEEEKERRKNNAEDLNPQKESIAKEIYELVISQEREKLKLGFEFDIEFSMYNLLQTYKYDTDLSIKTTKELSRQLLPKTTIVEWHNKSGIKREIKKIIYDILDSFEVPEDTNLKLSEDILTLLGKDSFASEN